MAGLRLLLVVMLIESCVAHDDPCAHCTMPACKRLGDKIGVKARCQLKSDQCDVFQRDGWKFCLDDQKCTCCIPECGQPKPACIDAGGVCQLRTAKCDGDLLRGNTFCFYGKTCVCCAPIDCSKKTLRPCEALNGTCISQDEVCNGREVTDKTFCKSSDTCKCCFPDTPCGKSTSTTSTITTTTSTTTTTYTPTPTTTTSTTTTTTPMPTITTTEPGWCSRLGGVLIESQCLRFSSETLTWEEAKDKCASNGGQLATFENNPGKVLAYVLKHYGGVAFFAGGSDLAQEGSWKWLNGKPIGHLPWSQYNPDNCCGGQNCLTVGYNGGYDDDICDKNKQYICELVLRWSEPTNACIKGNNNKHITVSTIEICKQNCIEANDFVCRSFEYKAENGECHLSSLTSTSQDYGKPCYIDGFLFSEIQEDN